MKINKKVLFVSAILVLLSLVLTLAKDKVSNQENGITIANDYPAIEVFSIDDGVSLCNDYPAIEVFSIDKGMLLCNDYPAIEVF